MKVTQNPKTGKLIVDGEGAVIHIERYLPMDDPIEKVTNFIFRAVKVDKDPSTVPAGASQRP